MVAEKIIAYTAGLVDGEGTVTLSRMKANERRCPVVSISSTTYELMLFMKQHFGGAISTLSRAATQGHKQAWHWQTSRNGAISLLSLIESYMVEPAKKRRARLIIERYKSVTPRNGKYTDELIEQREAFEQEFFAQ